MREIIKELNKHSLSIATGVSYSRLRKYAVGQVKDLSDEEKKRIYEYLLQLAEKANPEKNI